MIELGKKDLNLLKSTLRKIDKNTSKIGKTEEGKKEIRKRINKTKERLKDPEYWPPDSPPSLPNFSNNNVSTLKRQLTERGLETKGRKMELSFRLVTNSGRNFLSLVNIPKLKEILRARGKPVSGTKSDLISRIAEDRCYLTDYPKSIDKMEKKVQEEMDGTKIDAKSSELRLHGKHIPSVWYWNDAFWGILLFIAALVSTFEISKHSYQQELEDFNQTLAEYHDAGFVCEYDGDGNPLQTIHGSLVLDGVDDCDNGKDEEDPFWSLSDAQDYHYGEPEFWPWQFCCILLPIFVILPLFIAFSLWAFIPFDSVVLAHAQKYDNLKEAVDEANRVYIQGEEKMRLEVEKSIRLTNQKMEKELLSAKLGQFESEMETVNLELEELNRERNDLYAIIKHLIPYSEFL